MSSFGTDKSSGSISESSGSGGFDGSVDSSSSDSSSSDSSSSDSSSSGSLSSGSGIASFEIVDVSWIDTHGGDASVVEFGIQNTGDVDIQITNITGTASGFTVIPDTFPIPLAATMTVFIFGSTAIDVLFSGTSITVDSDIAGSKTVTLTP